MYYILLRMEHKNMRLNPVISHASAVSHRFAINLRYDFRSIIIVAISGAAAIDWLRWAAAVAHTQ